MPSADLPVSLRIDALDWPTLLQRLDGDGFALTGPVLTAAECEGLIGLYGEDERFRKRIDMARYRFGAGDYAYFAEPLPPVVQALRETLYARLAPVANAWSARLGRPQSQDTAAHGAASHGTMAHGAPYVATLAGFLRRCHGAGQRRPTPLLLRYEAGGYNCLHQDLYGAVAFPLQATCFLSRSGAEYRGGEFLLLEQRPRQQSRGTALTPEQGSLAIFPSSERPVPGRRGFIRARMRHGVSTVTAGLRYTLGIVFHDAQ
ncbi:MAG: 2OG-Fe(II) oxygenase [SAR324 cluster bacterium]